MIHMTHDRNHGRAGNQVFRSINNFVFFQFQGIVNSDEFHSISEFTRHEFNHVGFESLVNRNHHTQAHTFADNIRITNVDQVGQLTDADKFRNLEFVAFLLFVSGLFRIFFSPGTTVFCLASSSASTRSGQFGLGFTNLFLNFFFVYFFLIAGAGCTAVCIACRRT